MNKSKSSTSFFALDAPPQEAGASAGSGPQTSGEAIHGTTQAPIPDDPVKLAAKPQAMDTTKLHTATGEQNLPPVPDIIASPALATLVTGAADKELLLAVKLTFHVGLPPETLNGLRTEDFSFKRKGDLRVLLCESRGKSRILWHIDIDPIHAPTLQALLPESGPLFRDSDPYGRVQCFAGTLGIHLTRKCATWSCLLYSAAAGVHLNLLIYMACGGLPPSWCCPHSCPISRREATAYWRVDFDRTRISQLPRHVKLLTPVRLQGDHGPSATGTSS